MKIQNLIERHYQKLAPRHRVDGDQVLHRLMARIANREHASKSVLDNEMTCLRYLGRCLDEVKRSR